MKIVLLIVFLFTSTFLPAQSGSYQADLLALTEILEKTPSYKSQIRGDKASAYKLLYEKLKLDSLENPSSYDYFYRLAQLLFPIKDNHLGFYSLPDYSHFKTKQSIDSFIASKEFFDYPTFKINIDSLTAALKSKPSDVPEGIYHYGNYFTVGVFKNGEKEYVGIILNSNTGLWKPGQVALHLFQFGSSQYKAIYSHPLYKNFILQNNERYSNHSLANSRFYGSYSDALYSKNVGEVDHANLNSGRRFQLSSLRTDIQYLRIATFQATLTTMKESRQFYDSIRGLLVAPNLIVDLRNHEGGAEKEAKRYFGLLKRYAKKGNLYVILNNETLSQAEIFTLKLLKLKRTTTLGQQTKGMLSYGSNYGKRVRLPSGKFEIYPTDMRGNARLLKYEDHGIQPAIILNNDEDWIKQVIRVIDKD